ncbi:MAG TPA: phage portal protein, partial [Candidatus Sulfotelmatobacter sp.]|nr:phage portal protein [Candidatus Sulfotelmatobacter sp.]
MASPAGGQTIDQGILARAGRAARAAYDVFFGPEKPQQINAPAGTPPRTLDYPVGYNLNIQPRNLETISFQQMRALADSFDLIRLCVETRKDQMAKMKWQFATRRKVDEKPTEYKQRNVKDDRLQMLTDFFQAPDKEHTWNEWLRLLLEEMLVIDAPVVAPVSDPSGKLWSAGATLYALEVVDGSTIARKIDANGRTPMEPEVAYQQIIKGMPAVNFTREQLIYKPRNIRVNKFFGFSPVEQIIMTINIGLRRQIHLLNYYTEGNIPEAIVQCPQAWSSDQIQEMQQWFDSALAGNSAARRRITFVPGAENTKIEWTRDPKLKDELDEWLARIVCFAFSISAQPFLKMMNRSTAETSVEQAAAEGLTPILLWVEDLINCTILPRYFGIHDVEFSFQQ